VLPNLFRGRIHSDELVAVGIDEHGDVVSVIATQRLLVVRTTDFHLTVPAPAEDVVAAPGSESSPGLRPGAIIWQGFSPGRKVLASRSTLDPRRAEGALPLKVAISGQNARLENATTTTATTFSAVGNPAEIAKVLDALRADPEGRRIGQSVYVKVRGATRSVRVPVTAPIRVTGRIGATEVSVLLGGGQAGTRTIPFEGSPSVRLFVEAVPPDSLLRPPRGRSWLEAVRLGAVPIGRPFFDHAVEASLTLARVRQYDSLLANPDPLGPIASRYVYRTVAAPRPVSPQAPTEEGLAAWLLALIIAGSIAAAGGLAVLWANS
jgi:hypothetical protein